MNFMKTVQKIKEVKNEEVISGNDTIFFIQKSYQEHNPSLDKGNEIMKRASER